MRSYKNLDQNSLRAFYYSAKSLNFTKAANIAGLTQSGISQHIAKLEKELDLKLFRRNQRNLELTDAGNILYDFTESQIDQTESLIKDLNKESQKLTGEVRYGMPSSCLKTPHFPLLLDGMAKDCKEIDLKIDISYNEKILDNILSNELDFGFVTKKINHTGLDYEVFAMEEYVLTGSSQLIEKVSSKNFLNLPFLNYPGMEVFLELWQKEYFPKKNSFNTHNINTVGEINDLDGLITMCEKGMGITVLPSHTMIDKNVEIYKQKNKSNPMGNIYIVKRKNWEQPKRVLKILEIFWDMK